MDAINQVSQGPGENQQPDLSAIVDLTYGNPKNANAKVHEMMTAVRSHFFDIDTDHDGQLDRNELAAVEHGDLDRSTKDGAAFLLANFRAATYFTPKLSESESGIPKSKATCCDDSISEQQDFRMIFSGHGENLSSGVSQWDVNAIQFLSSAENTTGFLRRIRRDEVDAGSKEVAHGLFMTGLSVGSLLSTIPLLQAVGGVSLIASGLHAYNAYQYLGNSLVPKYEHFIQQKRATLNLNY